MFPIIIFQCLIAHLDKERGSPTPPLHPSEQLFIMNMLRRNESDQEQYWPVIEEALKYLHREKMKQLQQSKDNETLFGQLSTLCSVGEEDGEERVKDRAIDYFRKLIECSFYAVTQLAQNMAKLTGTALIIPIVHLHFSAIFIF